MYEPKPVLDVSAFIFEKSFLNRLKKLKINALIKINSLVYIFLILNKLSSLFKTEVKETWPLSL